MKQIYHYRYIHFLYHSIQEVQTIFLIYFLILILIAMIMVTTSSKMHKYYEYINIWNVYFYYFLFLFYEHKYTFYLVTTLIFKNVRLWSTQSTYFWLTQNLDYFNKNIYKIYNICSYFINFFLHFGQGYLKVTVTYLFDYYPPKTLYCNLKYICRTV